MNWVDRVARRILDRCVLRPTTHPIDPADRIRVEVPIEGDRFVECYVTYNASYSPTRWKHEARHGFDVRSSAYRDACDHTKPACLVVKFPGTAGRAERSSLFPATLLTVDEVAAETPPRVAQWPIINDGCEIWTWNPPGYGGTPGTSTLETLPETAFQLTSRLLEDRVGKETRVIFCGNSLGCLVAMSMAVEFPAGRLICRNPPDLVPVILRIADIYRGRWLMERVCRRFPARLQALALAAQCSQPAVFLMSDRDRLVPPSIQKTIHGAYAGDVQILALEGLGHDSLLESRHAPKVQRVMKEWMDGSLIPSHFEDER